jgi:hypothetical protein
MAPSSGWRSRLHIRTINETEMEDKVWGKERISENGVTE